MASVSLFSVRVPKSHSHIAPCTSPRPLLVQSLRFQRHGFGGGVTTCRSPNRLQVNVLPSRTTRICCVSGEDDTFAEPDSDQTPILPSDVLTMLFHAEGTMNEMAIPTVTKALQETEGITDLKVQVVEGIASVELTKLTTIQATGVASSLIETMQGSGFKLQTLNLSFQDEEDIS